MAMTIEEMRKQRNRNKTKKTKKHKKSDKAPTSMKIDPNKKGKNIAADIFENRKGDWRQIKDDDGNYNQEYLRRIRNGIPVKTA